MLCQERPDIDKTRVAENSGATVARFPLSWLRRGACLYAHTAPALLCINLRFLSGIPRERVGFESYSEFAQARNPHDAARNRF